jgi:tetratricopeptide (TPR) repeat protein
MSVSARTSWEEGIIDVRRRIFHISPRMSWGPVCGIIPAVAPASEIATTSTMNFSRTSLRSFVLALGVALFLLATADPSPRQTMLVLAQQTEPTSYEELIASGKQLMTRRKYEDALKAFKRANDLKGQTSTEALFLMANAYMGLEAYKTVTQTCDKVIELAANIPACKPRLLT